MAKIALGLMSGTSCDGVSLALTRFRGNKFDIIAYQTMPYPAGLRRPLSKIRSLTTPEISKLNITLGHFFGRASVRILKSTRTPPGRVRVIGTHGHTFYHGPKEKPANTLQLGEASIVAEMTGIPVVSDFRTADVAAGGEGAPLIPFFDQFFFGGGQVRALQNIGGISNVTVVGKTVKPLAFDNGPGNTLIDWAAEKITHGRQKFDRRGLMAKKGKILFQAVRRMSHHAYFGKKPPKSTGLEMFNERFIPVFLKRADPHDLIATLTYFTAHIILDSYKRFVPYPIREIIVSGGGALNETLLFHLKTLARNMQVKSIEEFGIAAQAKEPAAFAFLALHAVEGKINHLPGTTRAKGERVLGKISRVYASS